jgi:hypothetical protein
MSGAGMPMEMMAAPRPGTRRAVILAAAVVILGVAWYLFRPELLFVNQTVNEALPAAGKNTGTAQPVALASGSFHDGAHTTKGQATVHQLAGGERVLRLTGLETSNGPDLHVYLVAAPDAQDSETVKSAGFIDLGSLKGNLGDQNYAIPADADLGRHQAVTIWCARFGVNFGTAPLSAR